ncbi:DsbE family thiol:disulfide interchange protein [uncultured Methylibium sp.]|jgi:cytochrome c biogenesis protein CcmG/thiol:disulfide interchange protein DsbE|uniref:DsbE family thiol:disulfide interchange protein n=1 Tax=Ramlibacter sp. TaxID=1917967 RepID=UPI0025E2E6E8|nr:DsbE family thiol:disulfide interchange protein [uncultured Methylibium sp.]
MKRYLVPLFTFVVMAGFLAVGLQRNPREVPSPLVDKPAPAFDLPQLHDPAARLTAEQMKGRVWVLNVFASWCTPCLAEHPYVTQLARQPGITVIGLNYKDRPEDAKGWLRKHGDPYAKIAVDAEGRVGIDYGVYGVPETYLIDKQGVIRHKQIGPITPQTLTETILPTLSKLNQ